LIIPVAGMDPSYTNWGTAEGRLCLDTGILTDVMTDLQSTKKGKDKQVRVNSDDLRRSEDLATHAFLVGERVRVVFSECPVGSQSANAMKSVGVAHGIVGALRAKGIIVIEVQAKAVKRALTGNPNASKADMIEAAMTIYPDAGWTFHQGKPTNNCEHRADAIGAIHAGVLTAEFQQLMTLFQKVRA
jgi:Holliday junction resolvasome RuvABC endonuclease subunit